MNSQTIAENIVFEHDVRVKGWLDAPNIKHPLKGLFGSEEALQERYPRPMPGWLALVGDTLPAEIWTVEEGRWKGTGKMGGNIVIQVTDSDGNIQDILEGLGEGLSEEDVEEILKGKGYATKGYVDGKVDANKPDLSNYVDMGSVQTITGEKTFWNVIAQNLKVNELISCDALTHKQGSNAVTGYVGSEDKPYLNGFFKSVQSRYLRSDCSGNKINRGNNVSGLTVDKIAEADLVHYTWKDTEQSGFGTILDYWKREFPTAVGNVMLKQGSSEASDTEYLDVLNLAMASCIVLAREVRTLRKLVDESSGVVSRSEEAQSVEAEQET